MNGFTVCRDEGDAEILDSSGDCRHRYERRWAGRCQMKWMPSRWAWSIFKIESGHVGFSAAVKDGDFLAPSVWRRGGVDGGVAGADDGYVNGRRRGRGWFCRSR